MALSSWEHKPLPGNTQAPPDLLPENLNLTTPSCGVDTQLHFEALSAERSHVIEAGALGVREPVGSSSLPVPRHLDQDNQEVGLIAGSSQYVIAELADEK
jgi:hypothetical protein